LGGGERGKLSVWGGRGGPGRAEKKKRKKARPAAKYQKPPMAGQRGPLIPPTVGGKEKNRK